MAISLSLFEVSEVRSLSNGFVLSLAMTSIHARTWFAVSLNAINGILDMVHETNSGKSV